MPHANNRYYVKRWRRKVDVICPSGTASGSSRPAASSAVANETGPTAISARCINSSRMALFAFKAALCGGGRRWPGALTISAGRIRFRGVSHPLINS